jgi:hypothetical protein
MMFRTMSEDVARILQESNEAGIQFLRIELNTGHTLLDIAEVTEIESTRARTVRNAGRAYDVVHGLMGRLKLSTEEELELESDLKALKRRIDLRRSHLNG